MLKADLHTHTTYSDGVLTPEQLIKKANEKNISALSITDHDTVEAYGEAYEFSEKYGIELVTGCEFSCYDNGKEYHILGYGIDIKNDEVLEFSKHFKKVRLNRAKKIHEKLINLGVRFEFDRIIEKAGGASLSRPHIAQVLVDTKHAENMKHAFSMYLYDNGPAYYPKEPFPVADAVSMINRAGGVAVLAHPSNYIKQAELYKMIRDGLDGIEIIHPSHKDEKVAFYRSVANQYWLLATGGSDFHGNREYDEENFGKYFVSTKVVDSIKNYSRS